MRLLAALVIVSLTAAAQTPARTTDLGGGCGTTRLSLSAPLALGRNMNLVLTSPAASAPGVVGISLPPRNPAILAPGCILHLDGPSTVVFPVMTNANGRVTLPASIPANPALTGFVLNAQATVLTGTGALGGFELSNALSARVGEPVFVLLASDKVIDQSHSSIVAAASVLGVNPSVLVNDNNPVTSGNPWLPWSTLGAGTIVRLPTGEIGNEGFVALPANTPFTLTNFVRGLVPQSQLDPIPNVMPLSNFDIVNLIGKTVIAVVYDGSISVGYQPLLGNLQGARNGLFAFTVLDVAPPALSESQSSTSSMDIIVRIEAPIDFNEVQTIPLRNTPADTVQIITAEWNAGLPGQPGTVIIRAHSSDPTRANLVVTIDGFNFQVPMTRAVGQTDFVFTATSLVPLTGRRVTVSSSLGGAYNTDVN